MRRCVLAVVVLAGVTISAADHGPDKGTLVIVGGAMQDPAIVKRFIELAGGPEAPIVIIPTAGEADEDYHEYWSGLRQWRENFEGRAAEVRALGFDGRFVRKWRYYLAYCEAAFAMRNISVVQTVHTRPNNLALA